jgi:hypothetical protein
MARDDTDLLNTTKLSRPKNKTMKNFLNQLGEARFASKSVQPGFDFPGALPQNTDTGTI